MPVQGLLMACLAEEEKRSRGRNLAGADDTAPQERWQRFSWLDDLLEIVGGVLEPLFGVMRSSWTCAGTVPSGRGIGNRAVSLSNTKMPASVVVLSRRYQPASSNQLSKSSVHSTPVNS